MKKKTSILPFTTPVNLEEEQTKFFATAEYNPQFRYEWNPEHIAEVLQYKPHYKPFMDAVVAEDSPRIAEEAHVIFQTPLDDTILKQAQQYISVQPQLPPLQTIEEYEAAFKKAIAFLNLPYTVEISDKAGFKFRPAHRSKKLFISKHGTFSYMTTDSAVKHELTHLIRAVNGEANGIAFSPEYLPTEEGLASYMQDYNGKHGDVSLFQHAAQYTAMAVGQTGSFQDIYKHFRSIGLSEEQSWIKSVRQKYGYTDTSKPGTFVKPAMYFYHAQRIKELSEEERMRLFVGKIAIEELPLYTTYSGFVPRLRLQEFFTMIW